MRHVLVLIFACCVSVAAYLVLFGFLVSRPLVTDAIGDMLNAKMAYAREARGPKIFIVGGSNVRFSHRCAVLEARLNRPCINGGMAFGIGMDWMLDSFRPMMKPGDIVYLPLEYTQYLVSRARMLVLVDAAYRFRHDKRALVANGPESLVRAAFVFDLPVLMHSVGEMFLQAVGLQRRTGMQTLNRQGDEFGHDDAEAKIYEPFVQALPLSLPRASRVLANPDGQQAVIAAFLDWCRTNGIVAVGGLPTVFADERIEDAVVSMLKGFYAAHGAGFIELPNRSQYPRGDFFDTDSHLRERVQIAHSELIAEALRPLLPPP